jgi:prophage regulatory protein
MHHLVGLTEIAEMLGISRQRADQLVRQAGFPAPDAVITAGRIWRTEDVEAWARATGRLK